MSRKSNTQITKELAKKIVKKLKAKNVSEAGDAHDNYAVYFEERIVASFGLRRGSRPGAGHDHVPKELNVNAHFAKLLGQCPRSFDDYLREIGELTEDEDEDDEDHEIQD